MRSALLTNTRTGRLSLGRLSVILVLASAAGLLSAQTRRGTIQGVVTDSSGAVVPDARIIVIQIDSNSAIDLATNERTTHHPPTNRRAMLAPDSAGVPFVFGLTWTFEFRGMRNLGRDYVSVALDDEFVHMTWFDDRAGFRAMWYGRVPLADYK